MEKKQFVCPKCGNTSYESDQFQATGGNFAKLFDVQNKKFVTVSMHALRFYRIIQERNRCRMEYS